MTISSTSFTPFTAFASGSSAAATSSTAATSSAASSGASANGVSTVDGTDTYTKTGASNMYGLTTDDFMKLFLAQLQNQDPTKPVDDQQMLSQLSMMSQIQTLQNVEKALAGSQLAQSSALIGKTVIQERCRRRSIVNVGRDFSIYNCHLCRSKCPRSTGTRGPGWRKDFKTPA